MSFKILILDASQRSALAVTRSLGRSASFAVYTAEASEQALAGCSKFSQGYFCCPNSAAAPLEFMGWLQQIVIEQKFDLIIPVTEITSQLILMQADAQLRQKLPFSPYATVMALADKAALVRAAAQVQIPTPKSQYFVNAQNIDVETLDYPLVIKPSLSKIYTGQGWIATRVRVVQSSDEFLSEISHSPYLLNHPFMVQEFIPGKGAGVFALYDKGQPVAFFAHRRLREKPPEGGVSVLSESIEVDPIVLRYARLLLDAQQWHGVAMIEFKVAQDGTHYLMEVNTRFWGSLQLAIDAGVDFPLLLVQSALGLPISAPTSYTIGQKLRWFLGDLDSLYIYLRSKRCMHSKLKRLLEFVGPRRNVRQEIFRWNDWRPALVELRFYAKQLLNR